MSCKDGSGRVREAAGIQNAARLLTAGRHPDARYLPEGKGRGDSCWHQAQAQQHRPPMHC